MAEECSSEPSLTAAVGGFPKIPWSLTTSRCFPILPGTLVLVFAILTPFTQFRFFWGRGVATPSIFQMEVTTATSVCGLGSPYYFGSLLPKACAFGVPFMYTYFIHITGKKLFWRPPT